MQPEKKGKNICQYFLQMRCSYGNKCRFLHEGVQTYLLRHAQSQFNRVCQEFMIQDTDRQIYSEQSKKFQLNPNLIDCGLTQKGLAQIFAVNFGVRPEFDIVFTSPLQRALQTTNQLIQNEMIYCKKVIVVPQLSEVLSKICDFSTEIGQKEQKYKNFDFSLFLKEQQQWQDQFLSVHINQQKYKLKKSQKYLKILQQTFPQPLQSSKDCFQRTKKAIGILKQIASKQKAKKIVIISHNRILKYIAGRFNYGKAQSFKNCEVRKAIL